MIILIFKILIVMVVSYLIGSIPTGYLIVKKLKGGLWTKVGSGSTGATNVKRVLGTKWFFIVMALDALKGAIPVIIAKNPAIELYHFIGLMPAVAGISVIIGHSKSVFLKFTGGKSVAAGVGTIFALFWPVGLIIALIWGILTFTTKYVSVGSIIAVSFAPLLMTAFDQNVYYICFAGLGAAYVVFMHRENIKRLIKGTENKVRK